jgi:general secretion pathway protein D
VAPGILSVAGVFTDPQFQTVLRGLAQKKGIDVNASPSVTTKNGLKATVEVTRELIYPTEFDPPQLPQAGGGGIGGGGTSALIATPTTPTAFEMRKTGVEIEVEPVISDDGTVELSVTPSLTEFEGFVNYGSPIFSPAGSTFQILTLGAGGQTIIPFLSPERLLTPNKILQPIFKSQKVTTGVKVWDGATVVLGGAKVQRHTLVNDQVPILGNLPFVGRLFRSEVKKTDTKNIIIFVTVNVVDPSGQKVNRTTAAVSP